MPFPFIQISEWFKLSIFLTALTCGLSFHAVGQTSGNQVRITVPTAGDVEVEVRTIEALDSWSFRNAYAGSLGLGDRVKKFSAPDLAVRNVASGEFRSDAPVTRFNYTIDIRSPEPGNVSHASWLARENGVLMLADLLPLNVTARPISVELVLPEGWKAETICTNDGKSYLIPKPEAAIFLLGQKLQRMSQRVAGMELELAVAGVWPVKFAKIFRGATQILEKYAALTGYRLKERSAILIVPLPVSSSANQWKAETRGSTIILLIDPAASFSSWNAQVEVILTHEIFHLWVPNSLPLEGDYDWFFEGFTLYQALLMSLDLRLIGFREYLETLARVYDSYLSYSDNHSLLEASERRWTIGGTLIYDKGMLLAFMYDVLVRSQSEGRSKISDLYSKLFAAYADKPAEGNDVIIRLLNSTPEARELSLSFIERPNPLDLQRYLARFGFHVDTAGSHSRLMVQSKLTKEQKRLLRSLGYKG